MFKTFVLTFFCLSLQRLAQAEQNESFIHNCAQVSKSGVYHLNTVFENKTHDFDVLCDQETRGGGWTVVLQRNKGRMEAFERTDKEYADGFGNLNREFFMGLEKLHILTSTRSHCLLFVMQDFDGNNYVTYLPEFEVTAGKLYQYKPIHHYEGTEIGMPLFTWSFKHLSSFDGKNSPKTKNRLNLFGPYPKIGADVTAHTMGFYNEESEQSIPLRSIQMMTRPVNMYRKSIHETFAHNFYEDNPALKTRIYNS